MASFTKELILFKFQLYETKAGIVANKPNAVASKASEILVLQPLLKLALTEINLQGIHDAPNSAK